MEDIFHKINTTDGVLGVYVCDAIGKVHYNSSETVDEGSCEAIISHSAEIGYLFDSLSEIAGLSEITLFGNEKVALLKKEGNFFLLVLTQCTVNLAALNVLLNSVIPKMRSALSDPNRTSQSGSRVEPAKPVPNLVAVPASKAKLLRQGHVGAMNSDNSFRAREVSKIGDWKAGPTPPDAVGLKFVNHMYEVCEEYFGQSAREIFIGEMKALDLSPSSLSIRDVQDLIERLANNITDSPKRRTFRNKILGDV